jgi:hypothetical protein
MIFADIPVKAVPVVTAVNTADGESRLAADGESIHACTGGIWVRVDPEHQAFARPGVMVH